MQDTSTCPTRQGTLIYPNPAAHADAPAPRGQVVGAVGRLLRVERCERLQLVAAATRICIATCHDCVFYVGVNRPPLLIGDNRFLQARAPPAGAGGPPQTRPRPRASLHALSGPDSMMRMAPARQSARQRARRGLAGPGGCSSRGSPVSGAKHS